MKRQNLILSPAEPIFSCHYRRFAPFVSFRKADEQCEEEWGEDLSGRSPTLSKPKGPFFFGGGGGGTKTVTPRLFSILQRLTWKNLPQNQSGIMAEKAGDTTAISSVQLHPFMDKERDFFIHDCTHCRGSWWRSWTQLINPSLSLSFRGF